MIDANSTTENFTRRALWAQINLDAAAHNMRVIRKHVGPDVRIAAVVKANAYGHGAVELARVFADNGADCFAVSSLDEGVELRRYAGITKDIFILGHTDGRRTEEFLAYHIEPAVFNLKNAEYYSEEASRLGQTLQVHIAIDTGMSRVGFLPSEETIEAIKKIASLPRIEIRGIFTHFAASDEKDKTSALKQFDKFKTFTDGLEAEGITFEIRHCSNSAAIIDMPQVNLDMVRLGIAMYGMYPSEEVDKSRVKLTPAIQLKSHITMVKEIEAGEKISYGGTYTTTKKTKVATVSVGYGDGYPRALSSKGYVLIDGKRADIVGRVCMDQMMVDVTDIDNVKRGDVVTLIGHDKDGYISIEEISELAGTFNYEFVCDLGKRIPRNYYLNGRYIGSHDYFHEKWKLKNI